MAVVRLRSDPYLTTFSLVLLQVRTGLAQLTYSPNNGQFVIPLVKEEPLLSD